MLNFLMKSAVIFNIECYIYLHMYDLITRINLFLSYLSQGSSSEPHVTVKHQTNIIL